MLNSAIFGTNKPCDTAELSVGRFAPSPTGVLHLGSLLTAVASFCMAKHAKGKWLLRIEDIDSERCQPAFSQQILTDLERLGLFWDDEVRYQSLHLETYHHFLDTYLQTLSYGCDCSRKTIQQYCLSHQIATEHYPRICTDKQLSRHHAIRLLMPDYQIVFYDHLQGVITGNPQQQHGDIVIRRRQLPQKNNSQTQGMINYMLAVVIDDALQGVNQVVRGLDILPLTIPQLVIGDYLDLPAITAYYHLPLLVNQQGQKLSKQTFAEPIQPYPAPELLKLVLQLLKQPPVEIDTPSVMLRQAVAQWTNEPLYHQQHLVVPSIANLLSLL